MSFITLENSNIEFDPAFISAAELEALRQDFTLDTEAPDTDMPAALPSVATYQEARDQVRQMLESDGTLGDMLSEAQGDGPAIDVDDILADMDGQLLPILETGQLPADVVQFAQDGVSFARFTETDAGSSLTLDGQEVVRIGPFGGARDKNLKVTLATVVVVIDLIFVVLAVSGVKAARSRKADEAMGKVIKKNIKPMAALAKELLRMLSGAMKKFRDKDKPKRDVVVDVIGDIAKAVIHAMDHMWKHLWGDVKRIIKALLSSLKAIVTAIASVMATVLLAVGTAGAALAASLISLALALVTLVDDAIALKKATDGA